MDRLQDHPKLYPSPLTQWHRAPGASQTPAYFARAADGQYLFIKHNPQGTGLLLAEAQGLKTLAKTGVIRVPKVFTSEAHWLVMEAIPREPATGRFWKRLAEALVALHRHRGNMGFDQDNFLGQSQQFNLWAPGQGTWADFFWQRRLFPQLEISRRYELWTAADQQRIAQLESYTRLCLQDVQQQPQLLHGDLWAGNILCGTNQEPILIDPAVYYGHRETDLAMTELFGGFSAIFYQRYTELWPLAPDYPRRRELYNFYHKLNHANLYGSGFLWDVKKTLLQLCRNN